MKPSEELFLFKHLCQFITANLSQSERYYDFPEIVRLRIVSFLAACLMVVILMGAWGALYLFAGLLPDNLVGAVIYTSFLYGMICANFWVAWLVNLHFNCRISCALIAANDPSIKGS